MKTNSLIAFYTILAIASVAFTASAESHDYKLNVQDFNKLNVVDNIHVKCSCLPDSAGWAVFSCSPEIASNLIFTNNKGKLTVDLTYEDDEPLGLPVIQVYSSSLKEIKNAGDSTLTVDRLDKVPKLTVRVIGNGRINVSGIDSPAVDAGVTAGCGHVSLKGKCTKANLRNVGTGTVDAGALEASNVKCHVLGTGPVVCKAVDELNIYGAGSGTVYHIIEPKTMKNRSIGVKAVLNENGITNSK